MAKCKNCINLDRKGWCEKAIDSPEPNRERECYYFQQMTNADRIRQMSDEELAEFLMKPTKIISKYECEDCENDCTECVLEWLKKEVDDEHTD